MPREDYQESLAALRADVVDMGDLVTGHLETGLEALQTADEALAREVIEGDGVVNERYLELEAECVELLALQQPVAGDLRLVTASFKVLTDLERVGDLATNLGEYALAAEGDPEPSVALDEIGQEALALLERALEAYETGDVAACRAVAADDDRVDTLCQHASDRIVRDLIERETKDAWAIEALLDDVSRLLLTIRDLERVGDHAVNVAARTLYMVENDPELIY